jgi:hypothetical protein
MPPCAMRSSRTLYQLAISSAPLSLTVPYLSFTPAMLVGIAFMFLGESQRNCNQA